ncbi:imidazole glycerol phosphate synthase subunit HisH [Lysobacter sp. A03]|uniref:imidazole glycerol phosphate synthase subunit HisH n=1 Tax=Lysobacter sp. A03 TaxID=1199154 RepID=UPI0005B6D132|nr:imidazole glycerol phosphate synthase subunit HisH [Lysobacter sp. A03]KIQ97372.1 Imidazole glycerol phosphate synthase amidotransferase subunit [Lysobacter sp. A03]
MSATVLVDAGGANLGSVRYALERLGADVRVSRDAAEIAAASRVILPGVGAAASGMALLRERDLNKVLRELTQPLLGICLGMQLLYEGSEEGGVECLGLIPGSVRKLAAEPARDGKPAIRVPHMGWNTLQLRQSDPLLEGIGDGAHVYFVHSYAAPVDERTLATCQHGSPFAAVVRSGNRYGAQFHPERSSTVGMRLLANFLKIPA